MTNRDLLARLARNAAATLALAAALAAPRPADAAVARLDVGSQVGATQTTATSVSGTKTIGAGSNRLLLVTIYVQKSASDATFSVTTATYGGQALTQAVITPGTTTSRDKVYVGYLRETGIAAASNTTINVTINAGTTNGWAVFAQTYQGVDQTTPITATAHNFSETNTNTSASFGSAIAVNAGGYSFYALAFNSTGGTRTLPASYVGNWSLTTSSPSAFGDDKAVAATGTENPTITYSAGQRYVLGAVTLNPAASATTTLADGTNPGNVTQLAPGGAETPLDAFTLAASAGTDTVTALTVTLAAGTSAGISQVRIMSGSGCTGTQYFSAVAPASDVVSFSGGTTIPVTTTATPYYVCITPDPHAAMAAPPGSVYAVTGTVTAYTCTNAKAGTDTASATVNIDNASSPNVTGASATPTAGTVTANWTNPGAGTAPGTDYGSYVVVLGSTTSVTAVPAEGTASYTAGGTIGTASIVCAGNIATCAKTGLGAGQAYYLKIFTRDLVNNWSAGVQVNATTPAGSTTSIADGANPGNVNQLAPGGAETPLDAFTLAASAGTDTVTALTVTLAAGTSAGISQVRIMSGSTCTGTQYFAAVANPASDVVSFSGGTTIPVTTTATPYYVCITPKAQAAMPAPPGSVYAVTGTVTSYTCTNAKSGTDTGSATVNIDNASSPDVSVATATGGSGTVTASWTNPGAGTAPGTDFASYVVVLGNTVPVTGAPAEGTASYTVGGTIGSDTVVCAGNVATCQQTGLGAGQTYYMEIFTRDAVNNWSAGVPVSAATQDTRTTPGALSAAVASCNQVNLSASYTGDQNGNNTVAFARGSDGVTFGTPVCAATGGGTNPRTCTDSTVSASTTYYYRATFADGDGVVGTTTRDSGAVTVGACGATLNVAAGTMPAAGNVAAGASGAIVGRITLTPGGGTPRLSSLSVSNTGTAVAGVDVAGLSLFDVSGASTVFVGTASWNSATSHYDVQSLAYDVSTTATLAVGLNVAKGATSGRTFVLNSNVPADVTVAAPATVSNSTTIAGNAFTITAGTPGGSKASNAPMVSILNPATGGVASGTFKVQVRVFNRERSFGLNGLTSTVLSTDNGATYGVTLTGTNTRYDSIDPGFAPTVTGRTYEAQVTLPVGSYTLRARAVNSAGQTTVSEPVQVTVAAARKGDGTLLVRDNASQLCGDCHVAIKTHSSETSGTGYGAWAATCRDCHAPHATRNIHLVAETIMPPSVVGTVNPAAKVGYVRTVGANPAAGWDTTNVRPTATASYVNTDNSGPCQVCHTRTQGTGGIPRWQRQGNADTHYTSASTAPCGDCHAHNAGFAPSSCLGCHGTTGAELDDVGASFWNNGAKATFNTTEWTYSGHGKTTGTYDVTGNAAANLPTAPSPGTSECLYCHDDQVSHGVATNPFRLRGAANASGVTAGYSTAAQNAPCLNCHGSTTNYGVTPAGQTNKKGASFVDTTHDGAKHAGQPTLGGKFCWDCHDPHGDRPSAASGNIAMIRNSVQVVTDGTYGYLGAAGVSRPVTYNAFTGGGPASGRAVETTTAAGTDHVGICQACHGHNPGEANFTKYWDRQGYDQNTTPSAHNATSATSPYCISCHPHDKQFAGSGSCTQCHASTQSITAGPLAGQGKSRRAVTQEFSNTWSHKRSASPLGTVSVWDCIVCHMEGDPASGGTSTLHADGYVNLRDPDTGNEIKQVTWNGGTPGAYTSDPVLVASFAQWSRNLSSASIEPAVAAVQINQCLKCHDYNGAASTLAQVPGGSAGKPFATTISGAGYTGVGITAGGLAGAVTDIDAAFTTTNATYHPVKGKQNNSYVTATRMNAPWNGLTKTAGNTTSWGYLISCWDCHAPVGASGVQSSTVTAHGAPATVRGATWSTTSPLCKTCHIAYTSGNAHGTGSAFNSSVNSGMNTYIQNQCHYCHASGVTKPQRPQAAEDVHGFDRFGAHMNTDKWWPVGATDTYRPYAFMRNVGSTYSGRWVTANSWKPLSGPGVPAGTATCGGTMSTSNCSNGMDTYTPGGQY